MPPGASIPIVLESRLDSDSSAPGTVVHAHLRNPLVVRGRTLALAGTTLALTVTGVRRASADVEGEIFLRVGPLRLADGADLPMALPHVALSVPLVAANPREITLPGTPSGAPPRGTHLVLPAGTILRAITAASLDATDPQKTVVVTPPPYTISSDRPYSAFTPIPLMTYDPRNFTPPPRRGRPTPTPSPSPAATESPTQTPGPAPTPS